MTVTIQLTTAGIDTGTFSIFSNLDLVTPLVTGVSRTSLLTGYPVVVPDAATSFVVKSNTTNCTNQITIPISGITTTTTTTTTSGCSGVIYGYDPSEPQLACDNYFFAPTDYYFGGTNLYIYEPTDPCGGIGYFAEPGYYSDGTSIWFWDGAGDFAYDSPCDNLRNVTIYAKRSGSISSSPGDSNVTIVKSEDFGATWQVVVNGAILGTSFSSANQYNITVPNGNTLWIGAYLTGSLQGISFGAALTGIETTCLNLMAYCGNPSITSNVNYPSCTSFVGPFSYSRGAIDSDGAIFLNFKTEGNQYIGCS